MALHAASSCLVVLVPCNQVPCLSLVSQQSPIDLPLYLTLHANVGNVSVVTSQGKQGGTLARDTNSFLMTWGHSNLTLNGHVYKSVQVHAHHPSEHTIHGKQYPLEVHFVFADTASNLAVVGASSLTLARLPNAFWAVAVEADGAAIHDDVVG
ncbi:Aste57867_18763 [Aphanomyces stellatus]|uniref:Carbonic anhydrase n=1 Tax=Aphanomyces stellatus TaxID=120398 RepID=A0A485LBA3_9STRA|nr:hypothetical protein As57867_018699 [Aphanomyces stellatus]VFT95497.1 Aste57867_18763 [Aphanomyces stellatus]